MFSGEYLTQFFSEFLQAKSIAGALLGVIVGLLAGAAWYLTKWIYNRFYDLIPGSLVLKGFRKID